MIRRFDGFRRLVRRAAEHMQLTLQGPDPEIDLIPLNRILAGLGGPPASQTLSIRLREGDSLPLLLLFFLTQPVPVRMVLTGDVEPRAARLKQLTHLLSQSVLPMVTGTPAAPFDETVRTISPALVALRPRLEFDADGEVSGFSPDGAGSELALVQAPGQPLQLVLAGEGLHDVTATISQERGGWSSFLNG